MPAELAVTTKPTATTKPATLRLSGIDRVRVAAEAVVSLRSVDNTLRGKSGQYTRARVFAAIERLGVKPL